MLEPLLQVAEPCPRPHQSFLTACVADRICRTQPMCTSGRQHSSVRPTQFRSAIEPRQVSDQLYVTEKTAGKIPGAAQRHPLRQPCPCRHPFICLRLHGEGAEEVPTIHCPLEPASCDLLDECILARGEKGADVSGHSGGRASTGSSYQHCLKTVHASSHDCL